MRIALNWTKKAALSHSGYRSRVLLEEIVLSVPFRMRNEVGERPAPKPAKKEKGEK